MTAGLRIRVRHTTKKFFKFTPSTLAAIDRERKQMGPGLPPGNRGVSAPICLTVKTDGKKRSPYRARLYLFSLTPSNRRGHNSHKRGIRAGTIRGSPAGIDGVIYSNVPAADNAGGCVLGRCRAGHQYRRKPGRHPAGCHGFPIFTPVPDGGKGSISGHRRILSLSNVLHHTRPIDRGLYKRY